MLHRCCPRCGAETMKVIYFGLPGRLCETDGCRTLTGLAAYAPPVASEGPDGELVFAFIPYTGSYLPALWRWLTMPWATA